MFSRLQLLGMREVALANCRLGDWDAGHRLVHECLARAAELKMPEIKAACAKLLARAGDPRADEWLQRAHGQLQATAARICEETLRAGDLANIPDHRATVAAWAAAAGELQRVESALGTP